MRHQPREQRRLRSVPPGHRAPGLPPALILLLALLLAACAGPETAAPRLTTTAGDLARIPVPSRGAVLVVAPPKVPASWTGDETYKRTVQLVEALSAAGWTVIAPWEYEALAVRRSEDLFTGTSLLPAVRKMGVEPSRLWLLEARIAETAITQETTATQQDASPLTAQQITRQHVIDLTLSDPRLQRTLGSVTASIEQDPFMPDANEVDALPNLTASFDEVVDALTETMRAQQAAPPEPQRPRVRVFHNPSALERYAQHGQASLAERYGAYGELELLARSVVHYQFFDPMIDVATIEALKALPPGLRVLDPGALAEHGVQTGDYLVEGNSVALDGRHALDRFLREARSDGPNKLVVMRAGERVALDYQR